MTQKLNMDDWEHRHIHAAGAQGWCLSEVGVPRSGHCLELQYINDAVSVSEEWGIFIPQLGHDLDAVEIMHASWLAGEDHAQLAYQLLKIHSPREFEYWRMHMWQPAV
jgi:hypothetical protein